jgi:hypothetical protein
MSLLYVLFITDQYKKKYLAGYIGRHGKDVQLDGYSVTLTIKNLMETDFNVSYRLQLTYGVSQTDLK